MDAGTGDDVPLHTSVTVFVLSRCKFAPATMRALIGLRRELGPAVDLTVGYLGTLDAHGEPDPHLGEAEIASSRAQICVAGRATDEEWFSFLECVYGEERWRALPESWRDCAGSVGIEVAAVEACLESGEGDALLARTYGVSMTYGIATSPTLIIGDRLYLGERSEAALRRYICHEAGGPETRPAACAGVAPAPPIPATLLVDDRCGERPECDVSGEIELLEAVIPGLAVRRVDYSSDEGKKLFELIRKADPSVRELPLMVLDGAVRTEQGALSRMSEFLVDFGEGFLLALGNGWDPLAEICDNGKDDTGDGKADCDDPECADELSCRPLEERRLDLFVMSGCPYAAQVIPAADRALEHFGRDRGALDFRLQFIGEVEDGELSSMHGAEEVAEDLRMVCAQDLWGDDYRYMEYVRCRAAAYDSSDWRACLPRWMSEARLSRCAEGKQGRRLLEESFALADRLGIRGSPSWLLNNRLPMRARSTGAIVGAFCDANEQDACSREVAPEPEERGLPAEETCR
jgi:hypothetical protein